MNLLLIVLLSSLVLVLAKEEALCFKSIDDSFEPMKTGIGRWNHGIWWNSSRSSTVDPGEYLWGSQYVLNGHSPISFLSYFSSNCRVHRNITSPNELFWANFTVDESTSYVVSTFTKITEITDDKEVRSIMMRDLNWKFNQDLSKARSNTTVGIFALVFDGSHPDDPLEVQLVFLLSNQAGVLDVPTELFLLPRSVVSGIRINNWNYRNDTTTRLRLFTAIGSGNPIWALNHMNAGSGLSRVWARLSGKAVVGKKQDIEDVSVSSPSYEDLVTLGTPAAVDQLKSRYGDDAYVSLLSIEFPSGANPISYDISYGVGSDPAVSTNLGVVLGVIIGFVVAVLVVAAIAYCICQRPTEYQRVQ